jgi:hypothetical protein
MVTLAHLPASLQRRLTAELADGEHLLWAQMPRAWPNGLLCLPLTAFGLIMAYWFGPWFLFFSAHALGLVPEAQSMGTPRGIAVAGAIFMLPFAFMAVGMILAPLTAALKTLVSVHAVTNRRVLTLTGGPFPKVDAIPARSIASASHMSLGPLDALVVAWKTGGTSGNDLLQRRYLGLPDNAGAVAAIKTLKDMSEKHDIAEKTKAESIPMSDLLKADFPNQHADLASLPESLRARVIAALEPGEQLLYAGIPTPFRTIRPLLPLVAFAVIWTGFSVIFSVVGAITVWTAMAGTETNVPWGIGIVFFLIGTLFSLIGLALFGMPFRQLWRSAVTAHVVTDKRLMSISGRPFTGIDIIAASDVRRIERRDHHDGRGTLVLGLGSEIDADGDRVERSAIWHGLLNPRAAEAALATLTRR